MKLPFFSKKEDDKIEEYSEIPMEVDTSGQLKILIEKLEDFSSVDRILKRVREGNIVIAKIKELKEANMDELKHCITKMKSITDGFDGDIAGVGDEWLIVTPSVVRIQR